MTVKATAPTNRKNGLGKVKPLELPGGFAPPTERAVTPATIEPDDIEPESASVADTSGRTTFVARALRSHATSARDLANLLDGIPDTRNLVRGLRIMDRECADAADQLDGI
jgi:hypothetical protein